VHKTRDFRYQPLIEGTAMANRGRTTLSELVNLLREGGARTRGELSDQLGQGVATVSAQLQTLERYGIVTRADGLRSTGGRPATRYTFVPTVGVVLAADLGVRHATLAVTDLGGTPLNTVTFPIDIADGPDTILPRVVSKFDELLSSLHMDGHVAGIGVGIPGPVEQATGRPSTPPIMPGWDHYDIVETLSRKYSAPAFVDNDANLLALGERMSIHPDVDDLIYVKIASGVGSGVIARGSLIHGAHGAAARSRTTASAAAGTSGASRPLPVASASQSSCRKPACQRCMQTTSPLLRERATSMRSVPYDLPDSHWAKSFRPVSPS